MVMRLGTERSHQEIIKIPSGLYNLSLSIIIGTLSLRKSPIDISKKEGIGSREQG